LSAGAGQVPFRGLARNFFLALTALTVVVTALTDWNRPVPARG
jgi:hypothetical protein